MKGILKWVPPELVKLTYTKFFSNTKIRYLLHNIIKKWMPEKMRIGKHFFYLNKNDPIVSGSVYLGCYENKNFEIIKSILRPGWVFIDIGANIGLFTIYASGLVGNNGAVFAIEPDPDNVVLLKKNKIKNKLKNITIIAAAAGDRSGTSRLYRSNVNLADHRMYPSEDPRHSVRVKLIKLDDCLPKKIKYKNIFIKIDVQGFEWKVWSGLREVIQKSRKPPFIILEYWPYGLKKAGDDPEKLLIEIMKDFKIYEICNFGAMLKPILIPKIHNLELERQHMDLFCIPKDDDNSSVLARIILK
jgi:FkbM family methyltransferase